MKEENRKSVYYIMFRLTQKWPDLRKRARLMLLMYAQGELSRSVCMLGNAPALEYFRTPDQAERTPSEQILKTKTRVLRNAVLHMFSIIQRHRLLINLNFNGLNSRVLTKRMCWNQCV